MKKQIKNAGIFLILLGILLFAASMIAGWSQSNIILFSALALVVGGAVLHIIYIKRDSDY
ncbi:MAG: hypothetical protein Q4F85_05680 [Prevotella sp.]|nr:hypothetical protein [Prevotella sp.]